jgi:hypothetical protein
MFENFLNKIISLLYEFEKHDITILLANKKFEYIDNYIQTNESKNHQMLKAEDDRKKKGERKLKRGGYKYH